MAYAPETSLFQAVALAFFEEGFAADAQDFGGFADPVFGGFQRRGNHIFFDFQQRAQSGCSSRAAGRGGANRVGEVVGSQDFASRENDRAFNGVAQLADVARPGVGSEHGARGFAQPDIGAAVDGAQRGEEM